ncbi:MAG: phosphonate ABC transporter, permease protein PhnE [Hyphomicrobiaceae bacterium]
MAAVSRPAASPPNVAGTRQAFEISWTARIGWIVLVAYVAYAASILDFSPARFVDGLGNLSRLIGKLFPPLFSNADLRLLMLQGLLESLQIAILASAIGILISLPIGVLAARNLMPSAVSWAARSLVMVCRAFHPIIVAILFVKAVGFGALAGILALVVASIGFIAKLFSEAIEEISLKQVEAIRATGAGFMGTLIMAVLPQVNARFVGFATYQLDSNLRNSTMVGIVGGGGIGGTLQSAFGRFDYDYVAAILLTIIVMIMIGEVLSTRLRRLFQ